MELNKLGNKSGIAGIILAALGLGGGTFSGEIARELAPPAPYVSYEQRQANETLLAAVDRLVHHATILEMNGESYRLAQSRARRPGDNIN